MCGILGICLDTEKVRTNSDVAHLRIEFTEMIAESERRGRNAAGLYIVNDDEIVYFKAALRATELIETDGYWNFLETHVTAETRAIIGHTRHATTGSPECNDNNHPVVDGPIIGVHNGVIRNHLELGRSYKKAAEVDTAAIMALLRVKSKKSALTLRTLTENLHQLEGPFAIAIADRRKPDAVYMARNTNPIVFHRDRSAGVLYFASDAEILEDALDHELETFEMPKNHACRINSSSVKGKIKFVPLDRRSIPTIKPSQTATQSTYTVPRGVRHLSNQCATELPLCEKCGTIFTTAYIGDQEYKCCDCRSIIDLIANEESDREKTLENRMALQNREKVPHPNLGKFVNKW